MTDDTTRFTSEEQAQLIAEASQTLQTHYKLGRHHVACAVLGSSGHIYTGIHLDTVGIDMCAEPVGVANAIMASETDLTAIAAVAKDAASGEMQVVNPCGNCLQLLHDFAPNVLVLTQTEEGVKALPLKQLLPYPYKKIT